MAWLPFQKSKKTKVYYANLKKKTKKLKKMISKDFANFYISEKILESNNGFGALLKLLNIVLFSK